MSANGESEKSLILKKSTSSTELACLSNKSEEFKSKRTVNVLDEESFIKRLENIIEKDFFPELEKLKIQQAYYEAVKNNDFTSIRDLYSKYSNLVTRSTRGTPSKTPAFFDTPNESFKNKKDKDKDKDKDDQLPYANEEPPTKSIKKDVSLDKFLSENTSEDNISFEELMKESEKKERAKLHQSWLFEKEKLHLMKNEESLKLENGDKVGDDSIIKALDTWTYTSKNTLMYIPDGVALTSEELLEKAKSNRLILHSNTRFNPELISSFQKQAAMVASATTSTQNLKLNSAINPLSKIGIDGKETKNQETPKIKGYGFVEPSPSPMPGRSFGDESPMMVWGEIESTPFRLDGSSTPHFSKLAGVPEFKMPDIPEREKIALNLEEKASAARRKKKNDALKHVQRSLATPSRNISSGSIVDRINSMSPAAKRLLSSKLSIKTDKSSFFSTPSPYVSKSSNNSSPFIQLNSPSLKNSEKTSTLSDKSDNNNNMKSNSITDNLLKMPKNS